MSELTGIDMKKLWKLVQEGKGVQEIMQELNIKDIALINKALQILIEEKNLTGAGGLTGEAVTNARYTEEGIRLTPAMLSGREFKPGDRFNLKVEKNRIILDKQK